MLLPQCAFVIREEEWSYKYNATISQYLYAIKSTSVEYLVSEIWPITKIFTEGIFLQLSRSCVYANYIADAVSIDKMRKAYAHML